MLTNLPLVNPGLGRQLRSPEGPWSDPRGAAHREGLPGAVSVWSRLSGVVLKPMFRSVTTSRSLPQWDWKLAADTCEINC